MTPYRKLPLREKQARHRAAMREPHVRCPGCDVATTARDLPTHLERRCPGSRAQRDAELQASVAADATSLRVQASCTGTPVAGARELDALPEQPARSATGVPDPHPRGTVRLPPEAGGPAGGVALGTWLEIDFPPNGSRLTLDGQPSVTTQVEPLTECQPVDGSSGGAP